LKAGKSEEKKMMERKKWIVLLLVYSLLSLLGMTFAEDEKALPFAAELKEAKFAHTEYQSILFGSLHWKLKGKLMKLNPVSKISLVRVGKEEENIDLNLGTQSSFVVQLTAGDCEIRSVFSEGRWYRLGHSFTLTKGAICYVGDFILDRKTEQIDSYDYQFTIDAELNKKKFNQANSAWSQMIRYLPSELKSQDGKLNLFIPSLAPGLQDVKREEKNLVKGAENGDLATVEEYIVAKRPIDEPDNSQRTPLMAALQAKNTEIAERLLAAGAAVEARDNDGWTPVMYALGFSLPDFARYLLEKGADVKPVSKTGWTPLHLAARYNQSENARLLIEKGADILAKTNKGTTSLSMALQYSDQSLALYLMDHGAEGNIAESDGWTPLMTALRYGKAECASRLIKEGVDINRTTNDGWTELMFAIRNDHSDLALALRGKDADPSASNKDGLTPLYLAAKYGSMEVVQDLLEKKVPLNPVSNEGWTPLHQALSAERGEVALLLISKGADLTKKTVNGWNPLHLALRNNQAQAAKVLIQKGAGLEEVLPDGWTPLMLALRYNQSENARILIEKKADAQSALPNGWTALHFAIDYGQPENARLLIAKGASKTVLTPEGKSPVDLAQAKGYSEIVRLLGGPVTPQAPTTPAKTGLSASAAVTTPPASWLPGLLGQFIPPRTGVTIVSAGDCGAHMSLCSAQIELSGSKKSALDGFKQDLMAAGWRLDQAIGAPSESGSLGNPNLWGLLNVVKEHFNITMLFLSNQKSGGKTIVDINLMNRQAGADMAAFISKIPRVIVTPAIPKERFVASPWAFTLKSANWCGPVMEKDIGCGTSKYTYTAEGEGMDLLKFEMLLESEDKKPIKDRFMKIAIRLRDKQGKIYTPVLAGTSSGDYFNLSQGGMQSALVPMQATSDMDWVFALPRGTIVDALLWPGLDEISLINK